MAKLVVEVLNASDLFPRDVPQHSTYVEVEFDGQKQRTQSKPMDPNPHWNEKLVFNIGNPRNLPADTIDVVLLDDRKGDRGRRHSLGRVRISGISVPWAESESTVQRYPLDKTSIFSHARGDLALRVYAAAIGPAEATTAASFGGTEEVDGEEQNEFVDESKRTRKKKEKEVRKFYSIDSGAVGRGHPLPPQPPVSVAQASQKTASTEMRSGFVRGGPPGVMPMQIPRQNPEFTLVETRPLVPAHMRYRGGDKASNTYDLVEQMHYLYVSVVKAKDLPVMDISGSLDPYVEVKLGNYKGVTKHLVRNQNPVWKQIFAFSKERMQSNFLEVTVKDKDLVKDDFVGMFVFDVNEVPRRVPPDSPLAPQWYRLETKKGEKMKGEIMLAVWLGTQADESFSEAWHSDAHRVSHPNLSNTRSQVYFSPNLYYLRVHVIEAQDLVASDRGRFPDTHVKVQLGNQLLATRPSQKKTINPIWHEELMFVASEPFEDIFISVDDRIGPGKDEPLGSLTVPFREVHQRIEAGRFPDTWWFNLQKPSRPEDEKKKEAKFSSKICLRITLDAGYHVLDESTHFSSNLQPSSKHLRRPSVGILELGILSAKNLVPMKGKETDAYCVAKYGNKWVRTRTLLDTLTPRWNEQYTWEVYDPCTVIKIGVFDNCHINGKDEARDQRIGKVRIRLSMLETNRVYTHYYPLLVLHPSGLKKQGELQLALRFRCTAWINMVAQYGKPLLPKMHYLNPIPLRLIYQLRHQAMQIVATRLAKAEPPLRPEVVEYMLDVDYNMFSLRRSKANFCRIMLLFSGITSVCRWYNNVCYWRNPATTVLVHVLFFILVGFPELILPTIFLYLFVIGIWNYRFRPRLPPHTDVRLSQAEFMHPDELDEEFDTFRSKRPDDLVRMRYDRLRHVAGRVQTVAGDLATQAERATALLSWRDPRATAIVMFLVLVVAVVIYATPFQVLAILVGVYSLRHPRFRTKLLPSVPVNFFKRLPAKSDMLI